MSAHGKRPDGNSDIDTQRERRQAAPVFKRLLLLALPTFGQLAADPAFVLVDTAIVGHVSDAALAGLSLGSTVLLTAVGLCIFLAYSTTSQVAHLFGAGKRREGIESGFDGIWLSLGIGFFLLLALFLGARPLCAALGGTDEVLAQAVIYLQTASLGIPGMLLAYAANGIFRGLQKTGVTLIAAVGGAALNTALDILFVIVWGWGIAGSGIATCIAQWFVGLTLLAVSVVHARRIGASMRPRLQGIASAGGDGFPLFLRTLALRAALVATVMAATAMGQNVLAGYQIVYAFWSFALNILDAFAIAGQTLVAAELGARRFDRARSLAETTARLGLVVGVAVGAVFALAGFATSQAFSPNPQIQTLASMGMVVVGCAFPLQGWMWALDGILIGAGDFRYLSIAMSAVAVVYIAAIALLILAIAPVLPDDVMRTAVLWAVFCIVLMGGRAVANGMRMKGDAWMKAR